MKETTPANSSRAKVQKGPEPEIPHTQQAERPIQGLLAVSLPDNLNTQVRKGE